MKLFQEKLDIVHNRVGVTRDDSGSGPEVGDHS